MDGLDFAKLKDEILVYGIKSPQWFCNPNRFYGD